MGKVMPNLNYVRISLKFLSTFTSLDCTYTIQSTIHLILDI